MKLGEKQEVFLIAWAVFLPYVLNVVCPRYGVTVREAEGAVNERRKARERQTQTSYLDGEHIAGSTHYARLARHLIFFADGNPIWESDHPAYIAAGEFWESLDQLARWGGNWDGDGTPNEPGENDAVHFSFEHRGVK